MRDLRLAAQLQFNSTPREMPHASGSGWVQIILYAALIAGPASQILAQDQSNPGGSQAGVRAKIEFLLGGYEDSASAEQWRSLGAAATPILAAIATDGNTLPTRRARSLGGLAALGGSSTTIVLLERLAYSEQEALIVRMSAVRELGQLLPEALRVAALRPLLKTANPQLRGVIAEVYPHDPAGCAEIRDHASWEIEAWRSRFAQDCGEQAPLPDQTASGPANSSGNVQELARPDDETSAETESHTIQLGSYAVFTDRLSSPITVNVPESAVSIDLVGVFDPTARVVVYQIIDPTGVTIFKYGSSTNIAKILPAFLAGSFSVLLPNSPTLPFAHGKWTFYLLGAKPTMAKVQAIIKTSSRHSLATGTLSANLFFIGVPHLNSKTAQTDPNFQKILSKVRGIYAQIGVEIGELTYIDITGPNATRFADLIESDLSLLFQLSGNPKARRNAINLFLVHSIGSGGGFVTLGESGGIPGAPVRGATSSGVALTMADFPQGLDDIANTWAHESGHWLGLFHTTEANGLAFDPLPDTPQCSQVPYDTNHDRLMEPQECVNLDASNLMFWTSIPSIPATLLTRDQQFVILRNPVVAQGEDFQSSAK